MKILIAEDDQDQLLLRSMLLSRSGFETLAAHNETHARELAAAHKPECAVIDLRFPTEEAGWRLVRDLKRLDPAMHVLLLTGKDARSLAKVPENGLIDSVLTKGSSTAALVRKLNELTASAAAGDRSRRSPRPEQAKGAAQS